MNANLNESLSVKIIAHFLWGYHSPHNSHFFGYSPQYGQLWVQSFSRKNSRFCFEGRGPIFWRNCLWQIVCWDTAFQGNEGTSRCWKNCSIWLTERCGHVYAQRIENGAKQRFMSMFHRKWSKGYGIYRWLEGIWWLDSQWVLLSQRLHSYDALFQGKRPMTGIEPLGPSKKALSNILGSDCWSVLFASKEGCVPIS